MLGEIVGIAIAGFSMAIISQLLSKWTKSPSQGFLISGAIFLVPGLKILNMLNEIREGNTVHVIENIYVILAILGTISFSVMFAAALVPNHQDL